MFGTRSRSLISPLQLIQCSIILLWFVAHCIDTYVKQRVKLSEGKSKDGAEAKDEVKIDERLERIVSRMFERCYHDGEYKQALGIALESRRLDHIKTAITQSGTKPVHRFASPLPCLSCSVCSGLVWLQVMWRICLRTVSSCRSAMW